MLIAPVVVSIIMFSLTSSKYVLLLAALGPVLSTASWLEARRTARRLTRGERARLRDEVSNVTEHVNALHTQIREQRRRQHPLIEEILAGARPARAQVDDRDTPLTWCLGVSATPSGITVEGSPGRDEHLAALVRHARMTPDCPVTTSSTRVHIIGERAAAEAVRRALTIQGEAMGLEVRELAHRIRIEGDNPCTRTSGTAQLHLDTPGPGLARLIDDSGERVIQPGRASCAQLAQWQVVRDAAISESETALAATVCLDLGEPCERAGTLAAPIAVAADGPVMLDLVDEGPHTVIGGTTGSGKSELLVSWMLALAARYSPERFVFLGIDFKGGATFDPLDDLPHCAGVVTDLDGGEEADRCANSLAAEVLRRERLLRQERVRSLDELRSAPPRLVVVVDEFQALLTRHPKLQQLFTDLGARGRSLGIHLVLCTQRPHAAARDALMANCAIRICLRVTSAQESQAVVGTAEAAQLPVSARGRAFLDTGDGPVQVQAPLSRPGDLQEVCVRWEHMRRTDRLVQPPLPSRIDPDELTHFGEGMFALADRPEEQWQGALSFAAGMRAVVLGGSGSGKTTALRAFAAAADSLGHRILRLSSEPGDAWLGLAQMETRSHEQIPTLCIIDDLDTLGHRFDEARRHEFADRLAALIRGTDTHLSVIVALQRPHAPWTNVLANCTERFLLRTNTKQDYLLAGGDPMLWNPDARPGRALARAVHLQFVYQEAWPASNESCIDTELTLTDLGGDLAVVSRNPQIERQLQDAGWQVRVLESGGPIASAEANAESSSRIAVVGTPEQWIATGGMLPAARARAEILLDQITAGEFRALLRGHEVPPPTNHRGQLVLYRRDNSFHFVSPVVANTGHTACNTPVHRDRGGTASVDRAALQIRPRRARKREEVRTT